MGAIDADEFQKIVVNDVTVVDQFTKYASMFVANLNHLNIDQYTDMGNYDPTTEAMVAECFPEELTEFKKAAMRRSSVMLQRTGRDRNTLEAADTLSEIDEVADGHGQEESSGKIFG